MIEQANNKCIDEQIKPTIARLKMENTERTLDFHGYRISNYAAIVKYFSKHPKIRYLNLSNTMIEKRDV